MTYARIEENAVVEYPVYEGDIRLRYNNVSFPTPFQPPEGYERVADVAPPSPTHTQNVSEGTPALVDGVWTRQWVVTDASADEIAARTDAQWTAIRAERNKKLAETDWTQLPDNPLTEYQRAEYAARRQWWRDVTDQPDPWNIQWEPTA